MPPLRPFSVVGILAIAILMIGPGPLGGASARAPSAAGPSLVPHAATGSPSVSTRIADIEAIARADHVPAADLHLPDFRGARPGRAGPVAPTYSLAPAPMGVADLGLRNVSGTLKPYVLDTTSVRGAATLTDAQSVYVDGDGPDMFGLQMNAVATGVELRGKGGYEFWAQDFASYTSSNGSLTLGDNLWNFSNDKLNNFDAASIYQHGNNGTVVAPVYYYATGPTFVVHYPFTITFYLNATDVGKRPAIYFNYSLAYTEGVTLEHAHGSFDYVVFASTILPIPIVTAPTPQFQANGTGVDPVGLPNDLELVLVGNDDGDTTTFVALNAAFALATWNATDRAYHAVPTAFDAGSDTGETSDGVGVFFNETAGPTVQPVALLTLGPSYLRGLWNYSSSPGYRVLSATMTPMNAFLLVTPGTAFNATRAQWAPTLAFGGGVATIAFPNGGNYYFEWLLSDYRPLHRSFNSAANSTDHLTIRMVHANAAGVYTPLMAWGNAELANVSSSGAGTAADPYVLEANQAKAILPEFGAFNDYFFPVFPGILLVHTSDHLRVTPPSLAIAYSADADQNLTAYGLPETNHLQVELWNTTNLSLIDAPTVTGWLPSTIGFFPVGAVILWGSSNDLIASNTFYDQGISLAIFGGHNDTVWGNTFVNSTAPATNQSMVENSGNNTTGIWEAASYDLLYDNYFALPAPAYDPPVNPVSCQNVCEPATYTNRWNVSREPASDARYALGTELTGSIIGTTYQGGNYWSNYGTPANPLGRLPYTDGGRILDGGDYVPLVRSPAFAVTVHENGLAAGVVWGVVLGGVEYETNLTVLTIYAPNGTYNYTVEIPAGYTAPATGNVTVVGGGTIDLTFVPLVALTFTETGLLTGWSWSVYLVGEVGTNLTPAQTVVSTNATVLLEVVPGTYGFLVNATGYAANPANGAVDVGTTATPGPTVTFRLVPILTFYATGLTSGTPWEIVLIGGTNPLNYSTTADALILYLPDLPSVNFTWSARSVGYTVAPGSGLETPGNVSTIDLTFTVIAGTLAGTVSPTNAELWIDGTLVPLTDGAFSLAEAPGTYAIEVLLPGYTTYHNNVTVASGETTTVPVALTAIPKASSPGPAGIPYTGWALIALLAVVAAIGLLLAARGRRSRGPPPPVAPYAAAPAAPAAPATAAPATKPPWAEDSADTEGPTFPGARP